MQRFKMKKANQLEFVKKGNSSLYLNPKSPLKPDPAPPPPPFFIFRRQRQKYIKTFEIEKIENIGNLAKRTQVHLLVRCEIQNKHETHENAHVESSPLMKHT